MRTVAILLVLASCEKAPPPPAPPPPPPPKLPEPSDVALAIDMSKSMEEIDIPRDRLDATQAALRHFIAASGTRDRFALVLYAQGAVVRAPLTDGRGVTEPLAALQIGDVPALGTAIGDGLALAVDQLRASPAHHKAIVLLGDGDNNWVTRYDPDQATDYAKTSGIPVYTIMVGSEDPGAFGGMDSDPKTLLKIATATGGAFYKAATPKQYADDLADIRAKLDAAARPR